MCAAHYTVTDARGAREFSWEYLHEPELIFRKLKYSRMEIRFKSFIRYTLSRPLCVPCQSWIRALSPETSYIFGRHACFIQLCELKVRNANTMYALVCVYLYGGEGKSRDDNATIFIHFAGCPAFQKGTMLPSYCCSRLSWRDSYWRIWAWCWWTSTPTRRSRWITELKSSK